MMTHARRRIEIQVILAAGSHPDNATPMAGGARPPVAVRIDRDGDLAYDSSP
jgi:hypothetical protein